MVGIVCHDHTGPIREWTNEEQAFAVSIADRISLAMETNKRHKMEKMLIQSEKLKAMGVITSGIAHEFNNILAIISGNAQLLEMDYKDNKEITDSLHIIKRPLMMGLKYLIECLNLTILIVIPRV